MEDSMIVHPDSRRDKKLVNVPTYIPLSLLNEEQAMRNHGQTLAILNSRGGMSVLEILDNIHKRKLSFRVETQADVDELNRLIK